MSVLVRSEDRYRSAFGGLWVDRSDARALLEIKHRTRQVDPAVAEAIAHFIEWGYVIFPGAVSHELVDAYLARFDEAWKAPRPTSMPIPVATYFRSRVISTSVSQR